MDRLALALALAGPLGGGAAAPTPPQAAPLEQDAEARVQALVERFEKAQQDFYARIEAADSDEERMRLFREENPLGGFADQFRALALELKEGEGVASAWVWTFRLGSQNNRIELAQEAVKVLLEQHSASPQWKGLAGELRYATYSLGRGEAEQALRAIRAKTPLQDVQAAAQYFLAALLCEDGPAEARSEARVLLEALGQDFAEVDGGQWKKRAEAILYELDHLQIGMLAPDFEAVDQDGVKWKLSDYRGKVVVVDFWGFW